MRQWIEYAVENYRSKNSFGFQLAKDLKPRQIEMAIDQHDACEVRKVGIFVDRPVSVQQQ